MPNSDLDVTMGIDSEAMEFKMREIIAYSVAIAMDSKLRSSSTFYSLCEPKKNV